MPTVVNRLETDPLRSFRFDVTIGDGNKNRFANIGFMSVTGLNVTTDIIAYREGGYNSSPHKLPGQTDFSPVTFSRGLAVGDAQMMTWMNELFSYTQGDAAGDPNNDFRTTVQIDVRSHPNKGGKGVVQASFKLHQAWPSAISFSDLDAGANSVIVQQMTIVHEGIEFGIASNITTSNFSLT